jgi:hypothetical protein
MRFFFSYRQQSLSRSSGSGSAGVIPYRPFVTTTLFSSTGRSCVFSEVLVDSGSIFSIFPIDFAKRLGVVLQMQDAAGKPHRLVWRGRPFRLGFARVDVVLEDDNGGRLTWPAEIGFSDAPISYQLLGQQGALEFLDATFRFGSLVLELERNQFFPGSVFPGPSGP